MMKFKASLPTWHGFKWGSFGLLTLYIGLVFFMLAARDFNRWLYADHYVAAELEVTRFHPEPSGSRNKGRGIEGVIHPGGAKIWTSDGELAIKRFVDPGDRTGRRVPLRSEIEGTRLAVWYWPDHADVNRWWYPPMVIMPEAIPPSVIVRDVLSSAAFFGVGLFCLLRLGRDGPPKGATQK